VLNIKEIDDVIRHIEVKAYNSAIILLRAMKHDAEQIEGQKPSHNKQSTPCEDGICPQCGAPVDSNGGYVGSANC